ncbi:aminotransferase class V-fold PLP-dependent enzyme [Fodinibius sp.]|uniref:aminotransferase class V-fold PLP-dependent enzyme n=1 Tax=Fodinibius sp. TaxID=1872440 RepID=UPI002ACDB697|nr:aminotransferase class V-fold PLP-dependent enzyme [Fodinibius sp.]MDZ7658450.1 aminotransferase class V-fold PLP-dependent enzyme [Fodinibius sp.]
MTHDIDELAQKLAPHYSHFDVSNRLLFTGHSHQAWPDVAKEGLQESFEVAATDVDNKWEAAFEKVDILRRYLRNFYEDPDGMYCLGQNTHQLLVSWLSSFDLQNKPKIITTDSEFHSMSRQLKRLKEEGLEVVTVDGHAEDIVKQIERQIDDQVSAVMLSRVYFNSGIVNQHITEIAELSRSHDIPLLIDDYHGTNVVPLSISDENLTDCYVLIGGYKYLQWGEGNCFLRYPSDCDLRPAITGWFASFSELDKTKEHRVSYADDHQRFASGTFDSSSQFRAAKVVEFFENMELTSEVLYRQYQQQIKLLQKTFLDKDFDTEVIQLAHQQPVENIGGFLALQSPFARTIRAKLMEKGVFTDARGDILRFGVAPYITSQQITKAMDELKRVASKINP